MLYDTNLDGHIMNIIQIDEISEQGELQDILKKRGFDVPQATLSRRLKKLKISKIAGIYKVVDFNQTNIPTILNIEVSDFGIIVLHTNPGSANGLGYFVDHKYVDYFQKNDQKSGILGSIAGDDTVLIIVRSKAELKNTLELIKKDFPHLMIP